MAGKSVFSSKAGARSLAGLLALTLSGCDSRDLHRQLYAQWQVVRAQIDALLGEPSKGAPRRSRGHEMGQQKAELLHEVFQVVLLREPVSSTEFESSLNALSQGGTIEGVYNGFVGSEYYRKLERMGRPVKNKTLRVFVEELQALERELPKPTDFDVRPPGDTAKLLLHFRLTSLFTLKRILGNEALKVLEAKERAPGLSPAYAKENLARWYGQWAARMAGRGVDFGIALRNRPDARFHREWALRASRDSLTWEVLNRLSRLMNAVESARPVGIADTVESGPSRTVAEDIPDNPNVVTFPGPRRR